MWKNLQRQFQTKSDYEITLKIVKLSCHVNVDCDVQVLWKRGKEVCETKKQEMNEFEVDVDMDDTFVKLSTFYSANEFYAPKFCDFLIKMTSYADNVSELVAKVENVDMSPYIDQIDEEQKIEFPDSQFKETWIIVKWSINKPEIDRKKTKRNSIIMS